MKNVEIAEGGIGRRLSGTKFILTDKPESDQMEVWVDEDDRKLARLYATSNGTYYPEQYDAYGFSSVTVSIHGGVANPDLPSIEMPDGTIAPVLIPEIEMPDGTILPIDELFPDIAEDPLTDIGEVKVPDTVGEEGSAITGIDPEDGYTYMVGVDDAGNLDIEKVPTGISVTPPTQTEYDFGQPINYDGMDVTLVDKDGNIVKTKEYPDGKVSLDEMEDGGGLPEKTQEKSEVKGTWTYKTNLVGGPDPVCCGSVRLRKWYDNERKKLAAEVTVTPTNGATMFIRYAGTDGFYVYAGSKNGGACIHEVDIGYSYDGEINRHDESDKIASAGTVTIDGKTVYVGGMSYSYVGRVGECEPSMAEQSGFASWYRYMAWKAVYGAMQADQTISVGWKSPYSGEMYEDGTVITTSEPEESAD